MHNANLLGLRQALTGVVSGDLLGIVVFVILCVFFLGLLKFRQPFFAAAQSENTERKDSLITRVMTWLTWTVISSVPLSAYLQHRTLQWSELTTEILTLPALIVCLALLETFQKMHSYKSNTRTMPNVES